MIYQIDFKILYPKKQLILDNIFQWRIVFQWIPKSLISMENPAGFFLEWGV